MRISGQMPGYRTRNDDSTPVVFSAITQASGTQGTHTPAFGDRHAQALRNQVLAPVRFGYSTHPKLDYEHTRTVQDPVLGRIEVYRFSNGQELFAVRDDSVPLVSYGVLVKTGSANEKARENGVSHFLEHLIFKGTDQLSAEDALVEYEDQAAGVNAHTGEDQTFYFVYDVPKENLAECIRINSELVQNASIPPDGLESERGAVIEEIQMYADDKIGSTYEQLQTNVMAGNSYRRPILGPKRIIRKISREEILDYYNRFYAPQNRAILVVGDFDTKEVLDTVAEQLNKPFEASRSAANRKKLKPPAGLEEHMLIREDLPIVFTTLGFQGPNPSQKGHQVDKELAALDALSLILGGGRSSRLHGELYEDKQQVTYVGMGFREFVSASMLYVQAQTEPAHLEAVQESVKGHIRNVIENGVTDTELRRAKAQMKRYMADHMETQFDKILALEDAVLNNRFERDLGNRIKLINELTPADVQAVAAKYLSGSGFAVSLVPKDYERDAGGSQSSPASAKDAAPKFAGSLSEKDTSTVLPSGSELVVQSRPGNLLTSITVMARGGNRLDTVPGETDILGKLIERGTVNRTAVQLQQEMEDEGISLAVETHPDAVLITMKGLSESKAKMFELLDDLIPNGPAVREADVSMVKRELEGDYQREMSASPDVVVDEILTDKLYPNNHPYGNSLMRVAQSLDGLTPELLKTTYERIFTAPNVTVSMVGDVTEKEAAENATRWTTELSQQPVDIPGVDHQRITHNKLITRTMEDIDQSQIMRGWHAPKLRDEDLAAMRVMTNLLSGGFTSRFFQTFREKPEKALAYSVRAKYKPEEHGDNIRFYIGTDHENIKHVMELFEKEINLLVKEPPSEAELARVKGLIRANAISVGQPTNKESNYLAFHRGLDIDSRVDLLPKIDQVTGQDIQALAKKILKRPSVSVVVSPEAVLKDIGFPVNASGTFGFLEFSGNIGEMFWTRPAS